MKTLHLLLTVSAFLVGTMTLPAKQDQIPIPINTSEDDDPPIRIPSSVCIYCYYNTDYPSFCFTISGNTQTIEITIENTGTNEVYHAGFWGNGRTNVPISGNSGLWRITLILSNGDEYAGEIQL